MHFLLVIGLQSPLLHATEDNIESVKLEMKSEFNLEVKYT